MPPAQDQRRRDLLYSAFLGQESDPPHEGQVRRFRRFEGLDVSAPSESRTTTANAPDGCRLMLDEPRQINKDGGAPSGTPDRRGTRSVLIERFPEYAGNLIFSVSNGDATNIYSEHYGKEGRVSLVHQELWGGRPVNTQSRNLMVAPDPATVASSIVLPTMDGDASANAWSMALADFTATDLALDTTATCAFNLCNDLAGNVWIAMLGADHSGFSIYKVDGDGVETLVGTLAKDMANFGWTVYGVANAAGTGIFLLACRHDDSNGVYTAELYTCDTIIASVGGISLGAGYVRPRGLAIGADGNLFFLTTKDMGSSEYSSFVHAITTAGATVSGYPKQIDTAFTEDQEETPGCVYASATHLYYGAKDVIRKVAWGDVGTSGGSSAVTGSISSETGGTFTKNYHFAVDEDTGDVAFQAKSSEAGGYMLVWDESASAFVNFREFADGNDGAVFQDSTRWFFAGGDSAPVLTIISKSTFEVTEIVLDEAGFFFGYQNIGGYPNGAQASDPLGYWLVNFSNKDA